MNMFEEIGRATAQQIAYVKQLAKFLRCMCDRA